MSTKSLFLAGALGTMLAFSLVNAAEEGAKHRRHKGDPGQTGAAQSGAPSGGAADRGAGGDRAQMREQMMTRVKEQLGATDDEWNALKPKIEKVVTAQRDTRPFFAGMSSRRGGGDGESKSKTGQAQQDLGTALKDKSTSADDIAKKLAALRSAREKARADLQTAQKELKGAVNARQEAALVLAGMLD